MDKEKRLSQLFENWANEKVESFTSLPPSGSYREYYRIKGKSKQAIGTYNHDKKENIAFLEFSKHFFELNLNVPEIYLTDIENCFYLLEDLGDITLFCILKKEKKENTFSENLINIYRSIIEELPKFQIQGNKNLNYEVCYPRKKFDRQSMMWDLNYFKYYFLKLVKIHFDEQLLENDFNTLSDFLLTAETDYFLYRDFQSRNIMLKNNKPYFIDYQGGRKGALQYDIVSLLYQAKANIPVAIRQELLKHYINTAKQYTEIDEQKFIEHYYGYALIRTMQVLGAYGFRGVYEKRSHFLQSIPYAINNIKWLLNNAKFQIEIPTLLHVLDKIVKSEYLQKIGKTNLPTTSELTITINSFAFKNGIPEDNSGNSGGFVFDCRAIPNPGKFDEYKHLNGKDKPVIDFLNKEPEAEQFLQNAYSIIDASVEKYISRNFTNLMINFGCTGGQHRSVFCAENLTQHLKGKYNITVDLDHREKNNWQKE